MLLWLCAWSLYNTVLQCIPLLSITESAREKLNEAYTILKNTLEIEPDERFHNAVIAFHRGVVSKSSDQLVQALEEFGKNCEGKLDS